MKNVKDLKITYIGGGSRGWARTFMNDLAKDGDIAGTVFLYDIDYKAAKDNEKIGSALSSRGDIVGKWKYVAVDNIADALRGADFVIISVLPGTFDEMESDVHAPEKYGIYQSVGDSVGPGGIVRSLRTVPIFAEFANAIKTYCKDAWVINFTNPMTVCVRTLYKVFPEIKAFGCCHEVFGTQDMLKTMCEKKFNAVLERDEIKCNVLGVNHFTWMDDIRYKGIDLFPVLKEYISELPEEGIVVHEDNWMNSNFRGSELVKFDLFKKFGILAAAGDRHLAEFCPGKWYLKDPQTVDKWGFALTSVAWRKKDLKDRLAKTRELLDGKPFELFESGEESVRQIKALLGLGDFVTNVNIPNVGQIEDLPLGAVVETNAYFSGDDVHALHAGSMPYAVRSLVSKVCLEQEVVTEAALAGDYEKAFYAFIGDANVGLGLDDCKKLFSEMLFNTRKYLPNYEKFIKENPSFRYNA